MGCFLCIERCSVFVMLVLLLNGIIYVLSLCVSWMSVMIFLWFLGKSIMLGICGKVL